MKAPPTARVRGVDAGDPQRQRRRPRASPGGGRRSRWCPPSPGRGGGRGAAESAAQQPVDRRRADDRPGRSRCRPGTIRRSRGRSGAGGSRRPGSRSAPGSRRPARPASPWRRRASRSPRPARAIARRGCASRTARAEVSGVCGRCVGAGIRSRYPAPVALIVGMRPRDECHPRRAATASSRVAKTAQRVLEAGDLEDAAHLLVLAAEDEAALAAVARRRVDPLPGADDQGDPGRVDELAARSGRSGPRRRSDSTASSSGPSSCVAVREVELALDLDEVGRHPRARRRMLETARDPRSRCYRSAAPARCRRLRGARLGIRANAGPVSLCSPRYRRRPLQRWGPAKT